MKQTFIRSYNFYLSCEGSNILFYKKAPQNCVAIISYNLRFLLQHMCGVVVWCGQHM